MAARKFYYTIPTSRLPLFDMATAQKKIALWFRYGPADHAQLFHAMPYIVARLAEHAEVHYFGLRTQTPLPALIKENAVIHELPFSVDRTNSTSKLVKTALWISRVPAMARTCKNLGIDAIYIDETIPLTAPLALKHFGPKVAFTIADMFVDIYFKGNALFRLLGRIIHKKDMAAWQHLPCIFTRAKATKSWLVEQGVPAEVIHPVYDPCDFEVYHPIENRTSLRSKFGYSDEHFVLVHHGILHPNKGNDRIIKALAELKPEFPNLRYLLVGDGTEMTRLQGLVKDLNLQAEVQLTGWLPTLADVNEALNAGDAGLVMRVGEQSDDFHMTGALVHNMACGLPLLAARLGGVSEVVREEENGLLFDPDNMQEFKTKLIKLMGDPDARNVYGRNAHTRAREEFDMQKVTENTVRPLLALLKEAS